MGNMIEVEKQESNDQTILELLSTVQAVGTRGQEATRLLNANLERLLADKPDYDTRYDALKAALESHANILSVNPSTTSTQAVSYLEDLATLDYNRILYMKVKFYHLAKEYIRYHAQCLEQWSAVLGKTFEVEPHKIVQAIHLNRLSQDHLPFKPLDHINIEQPIFPGGPTIRSAPCRSFPNSNCLIALGGDPTMFATETPKHAYTGMGAGLNASAGLSGYDDSGIPLGKPGSLSGMRTGPGAASVGFMSNV